VSDNLRTDRMPEAYSHDLVRRIVLVHGQDRSHAPIVARCGSSRHEFDISCRSMG
jgi:hypothetical protein